MNPSYSSLNAKEMLLQSSSSGRAASLATFPSGFGSTEPVIARKRRGRPRKYNINNNCNGNSSMSMKPHSNPDKRAKKAQMAALGSAGQRFTTYIMDIAAGEDVYEKILAFSQGPGAIVIISAYGVISKATLRQKTYEGRYEIHSLSGSFVCTEGEGSPVGGLSVSFLDSDCYVFGGAVLGCLMAATPVQVVVGTFLVDSKTTLVRTGKSELFNDTLPASSLELPPSPAVLQCSPEMTTVQARNGNCAAPETFGNLSAGEKWHCAQNSGSCSYYQQPQTLNMSSLYQTWALSQFEAEMTNIYAPTTGARTRHQDGGYQYQGEDYEEEDFGQ